MNNHYLKHVNIQLMRSYFRPLLLLGFLLWQLTPCSAQQSLFVNLAALDGIDISPDNLFNYQVQSGMSRKTHALITGTLQYRRSDMRLSYRFEYDLEPGINIIPVAAIHPQYTWSSGAFRELFQQYKKLPQGIYEYCVSVQPDYKSTEANPGPVVNECVYHKSEDIFLINLVDPENDAKIYEYHPMLSWTVNFPFASGLTYRLRVAEIRNGQNNAAAISRNNPVYEERNLAQLSQVYPVYAKALEKFKPYAWTVDAYYKGILLGGAEPWRFTIIEDSLLSAIPLDPSYVDIKQERGSYNLYAPGVLKLKYILEETDRDVLSLRLMDKNQKEIKLRETSSLPAVHGDNRFTLDFKSNQPLKHLQVYTLELSSQNGAVYRVLFKYINPELISNK